MEDYEVLVAIFSILGALLTGVFAIVNKKAKEEQEKETQQASARPKMQQPSSSKQAKTQKAAPKKTTSTINFDTVDTHEHHAEEVENYDKIVGSLGDVSTEGCIELDGLRTICNDKNYNGDTEQKFDLSKVAQAMVYGEILDNPRFKKPYGK